MIIVLDVYECSSRVMSMLVQRKDQYVTAADEDIGIGISFFCHNFAILLTKTMMMIIMVMIVIKSV